VPQSVEAIPSEEYPTPTERPKWSVLDLSKIETEFGLNIPEWQNSLDNYFKKNY
jgi:dTDP-4-dehydrorhamnose reductase